MRLKAQLMACAHKFSPKSSPALLQRFDGGLLENAAHLRIVSIGELGTLDHENENRIASGIGPTLSAIRAAMAKGSG